MGGEGKLTPRLKLVRSTLETSNLARKYTHMCSFRKYTKLFLILLMSAFFAKKSAFFDQNITLIVWELW